jgi:ATP-dependent DNA helicase RecG
MHVQPDSPVTYIKGVGEAIATKLSLLGIETIRDLIYFFPRRYNDYSTIVALSQIMPGPVTVKVHVDSVSGHYVRRGLHITEATLSDTTDKIRAVWFNQPYRATHLESKDEYYMSGLFDLQRNRYVLQNPSVEQVSHFTKSTARIVPIYPESKGLKSSQIRQLIATLAPYIQSLPETLPQGLIKKEGLMSRAEALLQLHFPKSTAELEKARERLAFEEIFELLLASKLNKDEHGSTQGVSIPFDEKRARTFVESIGFTLTTAQKRASWEILQSMEKTAPMNRLLQGDVGAGKTVVGAFAAYMAQGNGYQSALLAPTEVLATQHAETLNRLLQPLGVTVGLLVGSVPSQAKKTLKRQINEGAVDLVIGTHALLQGDVAFKHLAFLIIDEQHRFGVEQRKSLLAKGQYMPHVLSMTATPIPRSLMLTVYGELDVSVLDELPSNRKPIITEICSPNARDRLYEKVEDEIKDGRQVYIICPLVSESDTLGYKNVEDEYKRLQKSIFKHRRIGLLHGRLDSKEKDRVMQSFKKGDLDILIATTVVEVGVDVPNATVMIIEGADRFGLAQLHQLRGRIGRGKHQSYCYLIPSKGSEVSRRLEEIARTNDGFKLAEIDLELRGPGEIYGLRQHGSLDLRIARITDTRLINRVQQAVNETITSHEDLLQYPELEQRVEKVRRVTTLN